MGPGGGTSEEGSVGTFRRSLAGTILMYRKACQDGPLCNLGSVLMIMMYYMIECQSTENWGENFRWFVYNLVYLVYLVYLVAETATLKLVGM